MIVERDEILDTIESRLDAAAGGTGSLVLLAGEAGSGKSTVVRHVAADRPRDLTVSGACDPLTTARPLGPFLEIAAHPAFRSPDLTRLADSAAELSAGLLAELHDARKAMLVIVEDLHWADEGTLDVLRFLGRRIDRTRAVILATYRNGQPTEPNPLVPVLGQLRSMPSTVHLETGPLSLDGVRRLVSESGSDLDPELLQDRTGGNPFFVTEVLATGHGGDDVPGNVQAAVLARVAELDAGALHLIEATAVSPRALEYDHAVALSGADELAVDQAVANGVVTVERGRFEFRHELARLAVEQSIPAGRRRRYHRRLLDRLIADESNAAAIATADYSRLTHHAVELGDDQLIIRYGRRAADTAESRGSNQEAAQHLAQIVRHADSVEPEAANEWRMRLGSLRRVIGDPRGAIDELERAADDCHRMSDRVGHATALRLLSSAYRDIGERTTAELLADRAVVEAEAAVDRVVLAQALGQRAFLAMLGRQASSAIDLARRSLDLIKHSDDAAFITDAEHALACANLIGGNVDDAIDDLTRLEQRAADGGDVTRQCLVALNIGSGCGEIRRYTDASSWLERAERLAVTVDMDQAAGYAAAWQARVAFETGRWDDVAPHVRRAIGEVGSTVNEPDAMADEASFVEVTALGALGRTRVRRGDPGGREVLIRAMELAADHDIQYLWPVACGLAEDAVWRGDLDAGRAWLEPIHERALQTESAWARGETSFWMARLGLLDATPPAPLADAFERSLAGDWSEAATAWGELGCPYERALALIERAQSDAVVQAISILDDLGARPAASCARQRLRDLGLRSVPVMPRTSTAGNPRSLTNRQREVLELVIEGASNQEIADRLFISKKTVEHHMSAVYGKLDVTDRPSAMIAGRRLLEP